MRNALRVLVILAAAAPAWCASKPHVVTLGKPQPQKLFLGSEENEALTISVRPLLVDGTVKEFTTGLAHDVTDRLFVVQRAFRMNDSLPEDNPKQTRWVWQRGGWLLVNRLTGHISQIKLPDFDPIGSEVSWYRDYAAYCGISDGGERWDAVVSQIAVRKPVYRKELGKTSGDVWGVECGLPHWERRPPRVTFVPRTGDKFTVNVVTRQADEPVDNSADP